MVQIYSNLSQKYLKPYKDKKMMGVIDLTIGKAHYHNPQTKISNYANIVKVNTSAKIVSIFIPNVVY